jgi:hypothetical protein
MCHARWLKVRKIGTHLVSAAFLCPRFDRSVVYEVPEDIANFSVPDIVTEGKVPLELYNIRCQGSKSCGPAVTLLPTIVWEFYQ